jgi:hypothetical protein
MSDIKVNDIVEVRYPVTGLGSLHYNRSKGVFLGRVFGGFGIVRLHHHDTTTKTFRMEHLKKVAENSG